MNVLFPVLSQIPTEPREKHHKEYIVYGHVMIFLLWEMYSA